MNKLGAMIIFYFVTALVLLSRFENISADDFDLLINFEQGKHDIQVGKTGDSSHGLLTLDTMPFGIRNITFTLETATDYGIVLNLEYLQVGRYCDSFLDLISEHMDIHVCQMTIHHGIEMNTYVFRAPRVILRVSRKNLLANIRFDLRFNSFGNQPCGNDTFRCDNDLCVWSKMVCDKTNNCGDESDEMKNGERCTPLAFPIFRWTLITMALVLLPLGLLIFCFLLACITKHSFSDS